MKYLYMVGLPYRLSAVVNFMVQCGSLTVPVVLLVGLLPTHQDDPIERKYINPGAFCYVLLK